VFVSWNNVSSRCILFDVLCETRGVLSSLMFSVYVNDMIQKLCDNSVGCYVGNVYCRCVMYADDLILVPASVSFLHRLIDTCCEEAVHLDMKFNALKSNIIRYGPKCTDLFTVHLFLFTLCMFELHYSVDLSKLNDDDELKHRISC